MVFPSVKREFKYQYIKDNTSILLIGYLTMKALEEKKGMNKYE